MPAIDQCEPAVINALQKAGWVVTHQPLFLRLDSHEAIYADLRLQHQQDNQAIIILEVKCFADVRR
jgi:XisH protein